jgi:hypothetical protein
MVLRSRNPRSGRSDRQSGRDQDAGKGAVESGDREQTSNMSAEGQLDHRSADPLIKSSDTDFPEPGASAEHSGEPRRPKKSSQRPKGGRL